MCNVCSGDGCLSCDPNPDNICFSCYEEGCEKCQGPLKSKHEELCDEFEQFIDKE